MAVTLWGTKSAGNILDTETVPFSMRLANVPVSYARYLGKMFWPDGMTVFYPMPKFFPAWQVIGSIILVLLICILCVTLRRRCPYLLFGWLWFLGTLLPTINLIPVGFQSIADRYTYLSLIGMFVMLAWGAAELVDRLHIPKIVLKFGAVAAVLGCAIGTSAQLPVWRNSLTLWTHSVAVTKDNAVAQHDLGYALADAGRYQEALPHYREGLRLRPNYFDGQLNLGAALLHLEDYRGATNALAEAIRLKPAEEKAQNDMGLALMMLGYAAEATNHFALALKSNPAQSSVYVHYGLALAQLRDFKSAANHYEEALRLQPRLWSAHFLLGKLYFTSGDFDRAADHLFQSLAIDPTSVDSHVLLGKTLLREGERQSALQHFNRALDLNPQSAEAHFALALAYGRASASRAEASERRQVSASHSENSQLALTHLKEALRLNSTSAETLNDFAWALATHPDAAFRNVAQAVALAERACELTSHNNPLYLGTLAAAYAEAGQFEKAVATAQQARELARSLGQSDLVARNDQLLTQYREGRPCREAF